jgi:hypothetical protein
VATMRPSNGASAPTARSQMRTNDAPQSNRTIEAHQNP